MDYVIKVSDFGLSEDVYARNYFRQGSTAGGPVKLPVKWMAPESLTDNLFSEKSDVVRLIRMYHCYFSRYFSTVQAALKIGQIIFSLV